MPEPELHAGAYLVQILFKIGPARTDAPIDELSIEAYEKRRGLEIEPWEAEALVLMSKAYLGEVHAAQKYYAVPPWPAAEKMWDYVRNARAEQSWDEFEKRA